MFKIVSLLILGFQLIACSHQTVATDESFRVYYNDPESEFIVPPIPLEKNAEATFRMSSPDVVALFAMKTEPRSDIDQQLKQSRIKVVNERTDAGLVITREHEVIRNGRAAVVSYDLMKRVLTDLKRRSIEASREAQ